MLRFIFALLLIASSAVAHERLIVLGGSDEIPRDALIQFAAWSHGQQGRVLLVPWATEDPDYVREIQVQLNQYSGPSAITIAPTYPMTSAKKALFLAELSQATGVFFAGGDQARILEIITDNEIRSAIARKFESGTPVAGTSAGTAIMSRIAIIGEDDPKPDGTPNITLGPGFGFLPPNVIVDQHFIIRNRESRLRYAMSLFPGTIGVGIDEPAGFIVEDGIGKVVGPSAVIILSPRGRETLTAGTQYNLITERKVR